MNLCLRSIEQEQQQENEVDGQTIQVRMDTRYAI